jgi:hypothetical protein
MIMCLNVSGNKEKVTVRAHTEIPVRHARDCSAPHHHYPVQWGRNTGTNLMVITFPIKKPFVSKPPFDMHLQ